MKARIQAFFVVIALVARFTAFAFFFRSSSESPKSEKVPRELLGVAPSMKHKYTDETFVCDEKKTLSRENINDNYCDCVDGSDEPGTSACNGVFYCLNAGYRIIKLPSSRVNDGVCDCCDGSDESSDRACANTCSAIAGAEKEKFEKLIKSFKAGNSFVNQQNSELSSKHQTDNERLAALETSISDETAVFEAARVRWEAVEKSQADILEQAHRSAVHTGSSLLGLDSLSTHDLMTFVLDILQMSSSSVADMIDSLDSDDASEIGQQEEAQIDASGEASGHPDDYSGHEDDYAGSGGNYDEDNHDHINSKELLWPNCRLAEGFDTQQPVTGGTIIEICNALVHNEEENMHATARVKDALVSMVLAKQLFHEAALASHCWSLHRTTRAAGGEEGENRMQACLQSPRDDPAIDAKLKTTTEQLETVFAALETVQKSTGGEGAPEHQEYIKAKDSLALLENEKTSLHTAVDDFNKFSSFLPFLALKDSCSDVRDGKFTYKVCLLASVAQTEDGATDAVDLGNFDSVEEMENGDILLKYREGQHCHAFGPRTADVKVTCGEQNKVLSAAEPSTCFYSFQMESPAACTQKFAEFNGLHI